MKENNLLFSLKGSETNIARIQYSQGDYILCMTSHYFFRSFVNVGLVFFVSHSNDMTSCQSSSAVNVSCNVAPFYYHQCGDTTSCIRQATFVISKEKRT